MEVIRYLKKHPLTFHSTSRSKPLKPKDGIAYPFGMLSYKWNNYYLTVDGMTMMIPYTTYRFLISNKDIPHREGIFTFHAGFEGSREGKLLLRNYSTDKVNEVIKKTKDLFEAGLVETYVTEWWRYLV